MKVIIISSLLSLIGAIYVPANPNLSYCHTADCLDLATKIKSALNTSEEICQDAYEFACGSFLELYSGSSVSQHGGMYSEKLSIIQKILSKPENISDPGVVNKAKKFYEECLNTDKIERKGVEPLRKLLKVYGGWSLLHKKAEAKSPINWIKLLGDLTRKNLVSAIATVEIKPDFRNTSKQIIYLERPSFGLPAEFLQNPIKNSKALLAYEQFITDVITELGFTKEERALRRGIMNLIDFEIKIATASILGVSTQEHYTLEEFQEKTNKIVKTGVGETKVEWKVFLDQVFSNSGIILKGKEEIILNGELYFELLSNILVETDERVILNYLVWRLVQTQLVYTSEALRLLNFRFLKEIKGEPTPKREEECGNLAETYFDMAIGSKYLGEFDKDIKIELIEMERDIRGALKERVKELDWIGEISKAKVINKVDGIRGFLAYPDWLKDEKRVEEYYFGLELGQSFFESCLKLMAFEKGRKLGKLRKPTDREEWPMSLFEVNAKFFQGLNAFIIPVGYIQMPHFKLGLPKHQNYARMGTTIAHELLHALDDDGIHHDQNGNWKWGHILDKEEREEFDKRKWKMVEQYEGYRYKEVGMNINGKLTMAENIVDNGALHVSFKAYQKRVAEDGKELILEGLDGYTPEQLFFLGFANCRCETYSKEKLRHYLATNPHSPEDARVQIPFKNSADFSRIFECKEDSNGMNIPEEEKSCIW